MKSTVDIAPCFQCGDSCKSEEMRIDDHLLCSEGCKTVYQILQENALCQYYSMDEKAGLKMDKPLSPGKYAFLDNPELSEPLYQFKKESSARVLFFIPEMHCASCIWLLERLYKLLPGVLESRVNFDRKEVAIQFKPEEVSISQLVEKLSALGYEPSLNASREEKKDSKALLYRLGVAGFCTGNIMLFSFPEYLGMDPQSKEAFSPVFQWLNVSLSLPVIFFAAQPFFVQAWKGLKHKNLNIDCPRALGIPAWFIRSLFEVVFHWGPGFFDSMSALVFFLLRGRWLQDRAYESLSFDRDFRSYFPLAVEVYSEENTDAESSYVAIGDLKVNECIRVRNQELIPADSLLLEGKAYIDYSFVNGESEIEEMAQGSMIHAGGRQVGGAINLRVARPVSESYLSALWNQQEKMNGEERVKTFSDWVGRYFTIALVLIAVATLLYWLPIDPYKAFHAFTAVLIVACPCVLVVAAPFAFGNAMRWLAKKGIYLKNPDTVEKVARVNEVVFDKKGNLTEGSAQIEEEYCELDEEERDGVEELFAQSSHPISHLMSRYFKVVNHASTIAVKELAGRGLEASWQGFNWRIGSRKWILGDSSDDAKSGVCIERNGVLVAEYAINWQFRSDLNQLFDGWELPRSLYSGDHASSRTTMERWFKKEDIHFECSPEMKLEALKEKRKSGHFPMLVGDGLNDAGALKEAWLGVAITEDVHAFTPACEVIMVGKSIHELPKFLRFCRNTLKTVKFSFIFSLVYNLVWMTFAVRGELQPILAALLMPISSITVFSINTLGIRYFARKEHIQ